MTILHPHEIVMLLVAYAVVADECFTSKQIGFQKADTIQSQRETITTLQEELSRMRRTMQERRKSQPEWDRNTFEEVGP